MNTKVGYSIFNSTLKVDVPVPVTMLSDQELINELSRRLVLVKWSRDSAKKRTVLGRSFVSPSCVVEEWDCRYK